MFYYTSFGQTIIALVALVFVYFMVPYLLDPYNYRRRFSGPWLAALTNSWLSWVNHAEKRSHVIHALHEKYGKFVRIGPDHISIADPAALEAVYGHGNGLPKSDSYKGFEVGGPNMFTTRDKADHSARRRRVAHVFSQQSVAGFEPRVCRYIRQLCEQWDKRCVASAHGNSGPNWDAKNGRAVLDSAHQFSYLLYDTIGDLALGTPFGMIEAQKDAAPIAQSFAADQAEALSTVDLPVMHILDVSERSFVTLAPYPGWIQDMLRAAPWNFKNMKAQFNLFGVTLAAASRRIRLGSQIDNDELMSEKASADMIGKLMEVHDENGMPLSNEIIMGEASLMLVAGTDTTSNATFYYIAKHRRVQQRLQEELDTNLPRLSDGDDVVTKLEQVKSLPYLEACINESFRLHPPICQGLPRIVPPGKTIVVAGEVFRPGSVVSVPIHTTNRSSLFGPDADKFRPERWLEDKASVMNKYSVPFSIGSRACIGRNVAMMNLLVTISTIFRRYDVELEDPTDEMHTHEAFIHKVSSCRVAIKYRQM
ncbi:hypothetical protein FRC12_014891 [Ceratobasidium sp. 428]|nr:hypothetical protein FRC12_014891 [Ceratobasidium sp. 428]